MRVDAELIGHVQAVFGLPPSLDAGSDGLTVVGRGAAGRIWRLESGGRRYALKELFRPVDEDVVRTETAFSAHAAAAGVRLSDSLPAVDGRFVVELPAEFGDGWLRLYRWIDGVPVDPAAPGVAARLGTLLGRLHASALPSDGEPDPWYDTPPDPLSWPALVSDALASGVDWGPRLAASVGLLVELAGLVTPTPDRVVTCHRDLHPGNVLVDADGELVLLDWDDVGAACPDRELAIVLVRWHFRDGRLDVDAVRATMAAYLAAGGTGRVRDLGSLGMSLASDLNYLYRQATAALDPATTREHREFAESEVREALDMLTGVDVLDELLTAVA